jgi:NitT/TauT family transport system ATP-binding protein
MLEIDGVAHSYEGTSGAVNALAPTSFQVRDGEFVAIVGPSGCGKSTLLRIVAGLLEPTQGTVMHNGKTVTQPEREIGLIFQQHNLMPWRTVIDNVALPLELAGMDRDSRYRDAARMLDRVGLAGFEESYPAQLSGGMAQRVAIGRALIQNPDVLLLDEPFGALDALTREQMQLELLGLWTSEHKTMIMVTHSITEALLMSDRVLVMSRRPGHIRAEISVPMLRPRHLEMIHSMSFGELVDKVRQNIEPSLE